MIQVDQELCVGCGLCINNCPSGAISLLFNKAYIDHRKCTGCEICISTCPVAVIKKVIVTEVDGLKIKIQTLQKKVKWLSQKLDKFAAIKNK
ncbi:4Fe-4S binding protein [candidate division WOR-3 bacterium]|nr:4Fe-4S binding protein [candidate division WOR-3 bacterium]NOR18153.1 4Fe-4S dicluster domain-containing protein [candidate division WOR-3 bacterium]